MSARSAWRVGAAASLAMALAPSAYGQASTIQRTADGKPDLHGVWTNRWSTPLERMPQWKTLVISPAEGEALDRAIHAGLDAANPLGVRARDLGGPLVIRGETRSSMIVDPPDGRVPLSEEGLMRRRQTPPYGVAGADGPEQRSVAERCLMASNGYAPFLLQPANNNRQVVQTKTHVIIFTEAYHQLRIIPLDGSTGPVIPRGGSSKGRWDGDTLLVETGGYPEDDKVRHAGAGMTFPISPRTVITERFTPIGPDEILYRFTVDDPALFTQPWTGESLLKRSHERLFEFACHEGDYSMIGILGGARVDERRNATRQ